MNRNKVDRMAELNAYQIAGLAMLGSTVAALTVVAARRRTKLFRRGDRAEPVPVQPAVSASSGVEMPQHFSEDLVVPGLTHTGPEIAHHDEQDGRSPEGV